VPEYGIKEVCALAAVTPRTIHFYIQQGLLAPSQGAGRGARYSDGHVARLRLIRRLQKEHLPLSEIRRQMGTLDDEEVGRALAQGTAAAARGSALDYVKSVKARTVSKSLPLFHRRPTVEAVATVASSHSTEPSSAPRSQWERIVLDQDLEIHIRRPLSRERARIVDKLLALAKQMIKEEQS
jgi:DNA-binding transcriptional MerR regulator